MSSEVIPTFLAGHTSLEGSACSELNPKVADHFFEAPRDGQVLNRVMARAALNICNHHCPVRAECREDALNGPQIRGGGIRGGVTLTEIDRGRAHRRYDLGITDKLPRSPRPEWLAFPEAAEVVEHTRLLEDRDEVGDE